jgi:hypothetical protein
LIAFAAKAGSTASDGRGPDSPYTTALLKHLTTPGLDVRLALGRVRDEVFAATRGSQEPFVYGSLGGAERMLVPAQAAPVPPGPDEVTWFLLKETTDEAALKRFVAQYPSSALRPQAEARIAALAAAQAAKPVPPGPDEVTWLLLKETTDEAALKRFVAQYPSSALRPQAEARIAALAAAQAAKPVPPGPDSGPVDEKWPSAETTASVKKFARYAKSPTPGTKPTIELLDQIREKSDRICPLECNAHEVEKDGHCVVRASPSGSNPKDTAALTPKQKVTGQDNPLGKNEVNPHPRVPAAQELTAQQLHECYQLAWKGTYSTQAECLLKVYGVTRP